MAYRHRMDVSVLLMVRPKSVPTCQQLIEESPLKELAGMKVKCQGYGRGECDQKDGNDNKMGIELLMFKFVIAGIHVKVTTKGGIQFWKIGG